MDRDQTAMIGVSIDLTQRNPYSARDALDALETYSDRNGATSPLERPAHSPNVYYLSSIHDQMEISLVKEPLGYLRGNRMSCNGECKLRRSLDHPFSRRSFLYSKVKLDPRKYDNLSDEDWKEEFEKRQDDRRNFIYPEGIGALSLYHKKPVVGLIVVKLQPAFFLYKLDKTNCKCNFRECIHTFLEASGLYEDADFCMLSSLGVNDLYILLRAANPMDILRRAEALRYACCCNTPDECKDSRTINWETPQGCDNAQCPIVFDTYTFLGFPACLKEQLRTKPGFLSAHNATKVHYEIQMKLNLNTKVPDVVRSIEGYFSDNLEIHQMAGRFDLLMRGEIPLDNLIELYCKELEPDSDFPSPHAVNFTVGRLLLPYEDKAREFLKARVEVPEDERKIARYEGATAEEAAKKFLAKQHELACEMRDKIARFSKEDAIHSTEFVDHMSLIDSLFSMHARGCRLLYEGFAPDEYEDVRKFFTQFFDRLNQLLDKYESLQGGQQRECLSTIFHGIRGFYEKFSTLLNDRLVIGMPLYESTQNTIYAVGAFEELIQCCRSFVMNLREVLVAVTEKVDNTKEFIRYMIVPIEFGSARSNHLFDFDPCISQPTNDGSYRTEPLVTIEMSMNVILNIRSSMCLLAHELGHYIGIIRRPSRVKAYVDCVSIFFVNGFCTALELLAHPHTNYETYSASTTFLLATKDMLSEAVEDTRHLEYCMKAMMNCMNTVMTAMSAGTPVGNCQGLTDKQRLFVKQLIMQYDRYDLCTLISETSSAFLPLVHMHMAEALRCCLDLEREICADGVMITMLNLSAEDFLSTISLSLDTWGEDEPLEHSVVSTKELGRANAYDSAKIPIRIIAGMMHVGMKDADFVDCLNRARKESDFSSVEKLILAQIDDLKNRAGNQQYDALLDFAKDALEKKDSLIMNLLYTRLVHKFMVKTGLELRKAIDNLDKETDAGKARNRLRELYQRICECTTGEPTLEPINVFFEFLKKEKSRGVV